MLKIPCKIWILLKIPCKIWILLKILRTQCAHARTILNVCLNSLHSPSAQLTSAHLVSPHQVELSEEFKANYERWLQREVYQAQTDWDQLLQPNHL